MKYTALAAAAVAVSGSLTGCSNPNRPVGKTGDTLKPGQWHLRSYSAEQC